MSLGEKRVCDSKLPETRTTLPPPVLFLTKLNDLYDPDNKRRENSEQLIEKYDKEKTKTIS